MSPDQQFIVVVAGTVVLAAIWIAIRVRRMGGRDGSHEQPVNLEDDSSGGGGDC